MQLGGLADPQRVDIMRADARLDDQLVGGRQQFHERLAGTHDARDRIVDAAHDDAVGRGADHGAVEHRVSGAGLLLDVGDGRTLGVELGDRLLDAGGRQPFDLLPGFDDLRRRAGDLRLQRSDLADQFGLGAQQCGVFGAVGQAAVEQQLLAVDLLAHDRQLIRARLLLPVEAGDGLFQGGDALVEDLMLGT